MLKRRRLGTLFIQGRGTASAAAHAVASVIAAWLAAPELVGVPFTDDRAIIQLAWFSCLPALIATPILGSPNRAMELTCPQFPLGFLRVSWLLALTCWAPLCLGLMTVVGSQDVHSWAWFTRNHVLLLSAGAVLVQFLPPAASWVPGALFCLLCWFVGTSDVAASPWPWALVNQPPDDLGATAVTVALAGAAVVLHLLRVPASDR